MGNTVNITNLWQPLETAPKDGTCIELVNADTGLIDVGQWDDYRGKQGHSLDGEWNQVNGNGDMTHWRPLPAPPNSN